MALILNIQWWIFLYYISKTFKIKISKLLDVQDLAAKYVPPEDLWFYNQFKEIEKIDGSVETDYDDNLDLP